MSVGGASLYDSANIFAATTDGTRTAAVRRPSDRLNFTGRLDHAVSKAHTLRLTFQQNDNDQRNLGIGNYDLSERAFARTARDSTFRISESGPLAKAWFGESRLQIPAPQPTPPPWSRRRRFACSTPSRLAARSRPADGTAPRLSGPQTSTGHAGSTRSASARWSRADTPQRPRTNYLGTYTFASLTDYEAGIPATYSRRDGNPLSSTRTGRPACSSQDDWRARKPDAERRLR